jgi:lipid-binding SYLF domain-containing protein
MRKERLCSTPVGVIDPSLNPRARPQQRSDRRTLFLRSRSFGSKSPRTHKTHEKNFLIIATAFSLAAADDTAARLGRAVTVLNAMTEPEHGIRPQQIASADCVAVIPGFKKGAAVIGIGYGRGFLSCRNGNGWSAPAAVTLESGSLGVQLGGEAIDIVILSLDNERRSKLLSDRFTIGSDASAAWGSGKSAHDDPKATILLFGHTKGAFAGVGLDGATLKPDESGNKALYGKTLTNSEIVQDGDASARPGADCRAHQRIQSVTDKSLLKGYSRISSHSQPRLRQPRLGTTRSERTVHS